MKKQKMDNFLKILDMNEDEQSNWVDNNCEMEGWESNSGFGGFVPTESLADLAFRLRDEVEKEIGLWWSGAISKVFFYIAGTPEQFNLSAEDRIRQFGWFATKAKPIHWIIAALIAKGK